MRPAHATHHHVHVGRRDIQPGKTRAVEHNPPPLRPDLRHQVFQATHHAGSAPSPGHHGPLQGGHEVEQVVGQRVVERNPGPLPLLLLAQVLVLQLPRRPLPPLRALQPRFHFVPVHFVHAPPPFAFHGGHRCGLIGCARAGFTVTAPVNSSWSCSSSCSSSVRLRCSLGCTKTWFARPCTFLVSPAFAVTFVLAAPAAAAAAPVALPARSVALPCLPRVLRPTGCGTKMRRIARATATTEAGRSIISCSGPPPRCCESRRCRRGGCAAASSSARRPRRTCRRSAASRGRAFH